MASDASPLENELVAFVEGHPETFSPQDVVNMRRNIIYRFGFVNGGNGTDPNRRALGVLVNDVLTHISKKVNGTSMNAFHDDVQYLLNQFELSVEFINAFLERLCNTERNYNPGGYVSGGPTHRSECEKQREWIHPSSRPLYAGEINIFEFVKIKINEYQSRILKLWADGLIHEGKITPDAIAEMHAAVAGAEGYERKMRQLYEECYDVRSGVKPNLDESMLLKWLTLFHVAKIEQMIKTYDNLGSLDQIVFGIISQFVPLHNVHGHSYIPQSKNHDSELNMLHLTCNVIARNSGQQLPVRAYLSSVVLYQCVQSVGRFPTTDQFMQFLSKRMIEKAAAFAAPPPPPTVPASLSSISPPPVFPQSFSSQQPSAPPYDVYDGGKKTRRKANKKRKHSKKSRHSRRR